MLFENKTSMTYPSIPPAIPHHRVTTPLPFPLEELQGTVKADHPGSNRTAVSFKCRNAPGGYWLVFDLIPVRPAPEAGELI
jgi:hypothetical protein